MSPFTKKLILAILVLFIIGFPIHQTFLLHYFANRSATRVKEKLLKFKDKTGKFPESIDELIPHFLKEIPEGITAYVLNKETQTYSFMFTADGAFLFPFEEIYTGP